MITWAIQISCIVLALVYWRKRFPTDVMNRHICKVLTCEQHCSPCKIICSIFTNTDNEKGNKAKFGWICFAVVSISERSPSYALWTKRNGAVRVTRKVKKNTLLSRLRRSAESHRCSLLRRSALKMSKDKSLVFISSAE